MTRRLLNLATALSLLLCVAAAAEWVRSAGSIDHPFSWSRSTLEHFALVTGRGQLGLIQRREASPVVWAPVGATPEEMVSWSRQFGDESNRRLLGFATGRRIHVFRMKDGRMYYAGWERWVAVPYWSLLLLTAPLPALWWVRHRRRRRAALAIRLGRCLHCGYDLHSSPERCPECGTVASARPAP